MPLPSGTRLGPYEIVAPLGQGGMGEVYRARDTRLERTVALKVLPPVLAADSELRARFEREARAISSLQHPNICALFDVGEARGDGAAPIQFLVLEYLEGQTLAERIARTGPLPISDALRFAIEVCDALDKSHRSGIVHRDLKPANVFLAQSGRNTASSIAKLLDFGLAKAATPVVATSGLSMLPTTPPSLTAQGTILGTFQYMAPEQIEGVEADVRTDIFAFGALLFEMLTGRTAFEGKTRATLLGSILKDDPPPPSSLRPEVPKSLDRIVATCLAKDPDDRWQSARDVLHELKWISTAGTLNEPAAQTAPPHARIGPVGWIVAAGIAVVAAIAGAAASKLWSNAPAAPPIAFAIAPPADATFATLPGGGTGIAPQFALSPDGRNLVFVAYKDAKHELWLRTLADAEARPLPGTEDASFPFWSPDSRFIGFFASGKLKKIAVTGGPPISLCDAPSGRGGTWNRDNVIVFTPTAGTTLHRVSAAGGLSSPASTLDTEYGESNHRFPQFLPDGKHFVYSAVVGTCCPPTKSGRVKIGALDSNDSMILFEGDTSVVYADGHLLFQREQMLMAQPFDADRRIFVGDAFAAAEAVATEGSRFGSFSAGANGVLVFAKGLGRPIGQLTWLDRTGRMLRTLGETSAFLNIALSPDERRVAATLNTGPNRDVVIFDETAAGNATRVTFDAGEDSSATWSNDNKQVIYFSQRNGMNTLRLKTIGSLTTDETLFERPSGAGAITPTSWSTDGKYVLYSQSESSLGGQNDVWVLPLSGDRKPYPVVSTPASELDAMFSPDGKWIAYQSSEAGRPPEVYVQPFPPTGQKFQVSRNGGIKPTWRKDGKELFYVQPGGQFIAVQVTTTTTFEAGRPEPLFTSAALAIGGVGRQYDVTGDGQRFLMNIRPRNAAANPLSVKVNWLSRQE